MIRRRVWGAAALVSLVALLAWPSNPLRGPELGTDAGAVPPIRLPQVRINHVDVSEFPKVRLLASILDRGGRPVQVKAIDKLSVRDGNKRSRKPYVEFSKGQPLDDRKDGKMWPADKAGIKNAAVVVVAGYQHEALRRGSLGRRLKEALADVFKGFGKADRTNIVWYGDRLYSFVGLKGKTGELTDVEHTRESCAEARAVALSGREIKASGNAKPPEPGTDLCGLTGESKDVATLAADKAFQGYFPRLFNLGPPFFNVKRYCYPPRQRLNQFGEFTPEDMKRAMAERDKQRMAGKPLDYETSAFDEALSLMLREVRQGERRSILLISDGLDGYMNDAELCRERPPAQCAQKDNARARNACVNSFLKDRLISTQSEFKRKALHWIGTARAADIRVHAVGMASLGKPYELERLRLLAEKTGGTYREAESEAQLGAQVGAMSAEVLGQLVVDFVHQEPEEAGDALSLRLSVELDPTMVRGSAALESRPYGVDLPPKQDWKQQVKEGVEDLFVAGQQALGYKVFWIVFFVVVGIVALIVLIVTFLIVRKILRWFIGLFRRKEDG